MRDDIAAIVAPAEAGIRLFVSHVAPISGEFDALREPLSKYLPAMKEFWARRSESLAVDARGDSDAAAFHALIRHALRENDVTKANQILQEANSAGVASAALARARIQLLCRIAPAETLAALRDEDVRQAVNVDDPEFLVDLARALISKEADQDAVEFLNRACSVSGLTSEQLATVAELYWQVRDDGRAWRVAEDVLRLQPENPRALNVAACCRIHNGLYAEAQQLLNRALASDPLFRASLLNSIVLSVNYLGTEPAAAMLREYIDAYPADLAFALRVASLMNRTGNDVMVAHIEEQMHQVAPQAEATIRVMMMRKSGRIGAPGNSVEQLAAWLMNTCKSLDQSTPYAVLDAIALANWLGKHGSGATLGRLHDAIQDLEIRLSGLAWLATAVHGLRLYGRGKCLEGIEALETARSMQPANVTLTRMVVWRLLDSGMHYDRAALWGEKIVKSDLATVMDWNNVIYAALMAEQLDRAKSLWTAICRRPSWTRELATSFAARATAGLLLIKSGDIEGGGALYDDAASLAKGVETANRVLQKKQLELGRQLSQVGETVRATAALTLGVKGQDPVFAEEALALLSRLRTAE